MTILSGVGGRALGIIFSPRATLELVAQSPRWIGILTFTFVVSAASAAIVLETEVGQLALLDQWERTASAFGRDIDDSQYAVLKEASRNGVAYAAASAFVGGPLLALVLSVGILIGRRTLAPGTVEFRQVLAIVSHAGVILALRQLVAAPMTYGTETLASPITMGIFFRMLNEASPIARFFGIIDLFVIWWVMVLAVGISVLYRRPARRLAGMLVGAYVTVAVVLAAVMAATGGTT